MSKLWIVHRSAPHRAALARMSGLAGPDLTIGAPTDADFEGAPAPAAILMALESDFELELDFADRHRRRLAHAEWLLLCTPDAVDQVQRLFRSANPEILDVPPSPRTLRAFLARAVARRNAASLSERRHRRRIAERFSVWLGGIEVPGLLRALDPALGNRPLLVRGVPGSGRSLLCRYAELFRGGEGPLLRLHAYDLGDAEALARRLCRVGEQDRPPIRSVWIDEVDALPMAAQNRLAEWILHDDAPIADESLSGLRWIATAGPGGLRDRLEPALEHAFAPLLIEIPALADHPGRLAPFAEEVARDWTRSVGGVPRHFGESAIRFLEAYPWSGDRAELEAVLRTSLAASSRSTIEEEDLCFPAEAASSSPEGPAETVPALPVVEAEDEATDGEAEELENAFFEESPPEEAGPALDESTQLALETFGAATKPVSAPGSDQDGEDPFARPPSPPSTAVPAPPESGDEASAAEPERPDTPPPPHGGGLGWRRLARSLSHEIRNPLVSIRTFSELLPEHFDDETFRARFTELVGRDVAHISDVLSRLSSLTERDAPVDAPVDVSALLEELLEERRERIAHGRLLVLRELERDAPFAWADAHTLRIALAGLLDRALESLPERGDLFVATRHLERGSGARLRILLRHHNPTGMTSGTLTDLDPTSNVLEFVLAQTVVEASGGNMTVDTTDARENVILIDLKTPPPEAGTE